MGHAQSRRPARELEIDVRTLNILCSIALAVGACNYDRGAGSNDGVLASLAEDDRGRPTPAGGDPSSLSHLPNDSPAPNPSAQHVGAVGVTWGLVADGTRQALYLVAPSV